MAIPLQGLVQVHRAPIEENSVLLAPTPYSDAEDNEDEPTLYRQKRRPFQGSWGRLFSVHNLLHVLTLVTIFVLGTELARKSTVGRQGCLRKQSIYCSSKTVMTYHLLIIEH